MERLVVNLFFSPRIDFTCYTLQFAGVKLLGNCFRARRTGNGQNGDGRRGVWGYGGSEGRKEHEVRG